MTARVHASVRTGVRPTSFIVDILVVEGQSIEETFKAMFPHADYSWHEEIDPTE